MIKRGRPKKEYKKNHRIQLLFDDETNEKLNMCCRWNGKTKTDIITASLNMYYNYHAHLRKID